MGGEQAVRGRGSGEAVRGLKEAKKSCNNRNLEAFRYDLLLSANSLVE